MKRCRQRVDGSKSQFSQFLSDLQVTVSLLYYSSGRPINHQDFVWDKHLGRYSPTILKGGHLDFSYLTELENINIIEIYMKKQYKSSRTKNHKIVKNIYVF